MTLGVTAVYKLHRTPDLNYPRLLFRHPRNSAVDFPALSDYAEHGMPGTPKPFDLFVKAKRPFDAVWIGGIVGPLVSIRLRTTLEEVAGDCLEFLPLAVNGEPFWILRVVRVVDALDTQRSEIVPSVDGGVRDLEVPVWRGERLADPMMFRIPQLPTEVWASPGVVAAYDASGCDGLGFYPRGAVV